MSYGGERKIERCRRVEEETAIEKCILESLMSRSTMTLFTASADHLHFSAVAEQDKIGWQDFVEGKITQSWECYNYNTTKSKTQSVQWTNGHLDWLLSYWN
jgi:hypothetical protein